MRENQIFYILSFFHPFTFSPLQSNGPKEKERMEVGEMGDDNEEVW